MPRVTAPDETSRFRLLYEFGCAFAARLELDELVPLVIAKSRAALDAEGAAVLLLDPDGRELYFPYVADEDPDVAARVRGLRFPADQGLAGTVLREGRALRVDDAPSDPRFYRDIDQKTGLHTRALLTAPLVVQSGTIGVLEVVNRRGGGTFDDADLAFLEALAASVAIAIENARLVARLKASEERLRTQVGVLRRDLARRDRFTDIVGTGPRMAEVFRLMETAATSPISVLIEGETGTGKELVARGIHVASPRAEGPFLAVNCAALPETLLESELFGHRRGAFTGATQDRRGFFESAEGGSIFLDEIGDMPPVMQAKLLRVLQEGEITPLGDSRPRRVDVRVLSATNRDLSAEVQRKAFREDLFYRLAAFPIRLPPLRERREDLPVLAERFLGVAADRHRKRVPGFTPEALELLLRHDWPGNVRELQNEIERAVALAADGEAIGAAQLSSRLGAVSAPPPAPTEGPPGSAAPLRRARAAFEARYIAEVLGRHKGNVSRAAEALGLSRVMLQKKMKEYRLRSPSS